MKKLITTAVLMAGLATAATAQDLPAEVKARQGQFRIMALNLGVLGGIAKGAIEYDAATASAAADSLVGVSMVHQPTLFKEGTDSMSVDGTRAMPEIWDNMDDFGTKWEAYKTAAAEMQTAAATGKDAIGPALGKLGGSCKGCHDTYRAPE
ncbi:c-type cytochrome [Tropicibacter naphthalenivorans]|uniref:Cytochrome c n=1 Tax=Tropicibacter naphthalenivorans TaxID=441103 RepID=A0A0P1G5K7_9RHOB|nr:cytochrome c [Tropicibacter naphthalenivorans]CUH76927.1 Cytochrome c' precursor [Tropicibacter naphthalenivorans]SMC62222.1 Cytochrome c556 [Tropicibacter naphthalenivorans]